MNQSIDAYYQVLNLAPLQVSIRLALASALKSVGRDEEALTVLSGKISFFCVCSAIINERMIEFSKLKAICVQVLGKGFIITEYTFFFFF